MCVRPIRLHVHTDRQMTVPCGQCIECRLKHSRQWAVRCLHEASLYEENCFVSLTYAPEHLPEHGSLDREAFPLFMKRLRKSIQPRRVRYFHCGEYGDVNRRPHYHALLFGFDFDDKRFAGVRGENPVFRSPGLEALWPFGLSEIGAVSFESAAYVARYVLKKRSGSMSKDHYVNVDEETGECFPVEREYATMSRNPGIGAHWYEKFGSEVRETDSVVVRGVAVTPPRFYDEKLRELDGERYAECKEKRVLAAMSHSESYRERRAREMMALARVSLSERSL